MEQLRTIISVDQALDNSGIAIAIPVSGFIMAESVLRNFFDLLSTNVPGAPAYAEDREVMAEALNAALKDHNSRGLQAVPVNKRKAPYSFGFLSSSDRSGRRLLTLHGSLFLGVDSCSEFSTGTTIGLKIKEISKRLREISETFGVGPYTHHTITIEGLALHGAKHSIAILPSLAVVYASVCEHLNDLRAHNVSVGVLPLSTWKKALTGEGNANKKEVMQVLNGAGFARFRCDDESDAVGMAFVATKYPELIQDTGGRIRSQAATREERKAQKAEKRRKDKNADIAPIFALLREPKPKKISSKKTKRKSSSKKRK